jgi:type I restriction-modification system DNA methylase subunit
MITKNSPIYQALMQIEDAFKTAGSNIYGKTTQMLAWIALARFDAAGKLPIGLEDIVQKDQWDAVRDVGLRQEAIEMLRISSAEMNKGQSGQKLDALEVTRRLSIDLREASSSAWDVLPFLTSNERRQFILPEMLIDQQVVELMIDMLAKPNGSIWTPFDMSGQIAITAARKGYEVNNAPITGGDDLLSHLLICIEVAGPVHPLIKSLVHRDNTGRPMNRGDFIVAAPPFNLNTKTTHWAQWEDENADRYESYDRSDAWAVFHLLNRTNDQLVILTSQSWLFATGQERRLREKLLSAGRNTLESVTTLPAGALSSTSVQSAITTFSKWQTNTHVHMTSHMVDSKAIPLDDFLKENSDIIRNKKGESLQSRSVSIEEIYQAEFVLLPQRLFRKAVLSGSNSIPLGQICSAIRPPSSYRGDHGSFVIEMGTAAVRDRRWAPVRVSDAEDYKSIYINSNQRSDSYLEENDIVLTVKGTLGLARLISGSFGAGFVEASEEIEKYKSVVSTSCLGLRLINSKTSQHITPKFLLMYLRSAEGQEQIRSLQVGAAMPHITVTDLLNSVRIPIPSAEELVSVEVDFDKLCSLEENIQIIESEMEEIADSRWVVKLA